MAERIVVGLPLGRWQTNCFVVGDLDEGTCVVIDPGEGGAEQVPSILEQVGVQCEAILVTHGHIDHFWAVPDLADALDVDIHAHPGDRWLWEDPLAGMGMGGQDSVAILKQQFGLVWRDPKARIRDVVDHDRLHLAGIDFTVRHNPGHTPGHVTFLGEGLEGAQVQFALGDPGAPSAGVLFSGDLVFAGSIGRTDFPRGSTDDIMRSLVDTVLPLDDDTLILSGHGPDTTVGQERATNPYLAHARQQFS